MMDLHERYLGGVDLKSGKIVNGGRDPPWWSRKGKAADSC